MTLDQTDSGARVFMNPSFRVASASQDGVNILAFMPFSCVEDSPKVDAVLAAILDFI